MVGNSKCHEQCGCGNVNAGHETEKQTEISDRINVPRSCERKEGRTGECHGAGQQSAMDPGSAYHTTKVLYPNDEQQQKGPRYKKEKWTAQMEEVADQGCQDPQSQHIRLANIEWRIGQLGVIDT